MTGIIKPEIHISDVEQFLSCRTKWWFSSRAQHNLKPVNPNKHLLLGSAVHHALSAYYGSGRTRAEWNHDALLSGYNAYIERAKEKILDLTDDLLEYFELGRKMVVNYLPWSQANDRFEVVMPEVQLHYDFGEYNFSGTCDGIVKDEQNGIWLLEHKTAAQMPSSSILAYTLQASMYSWVAQQTPEIAALGSFRGVMYNILRKAIPVIPKALKTGGLARRSNISSTPMFYMQAVKAAGLNPADYADFANTLDPNMFIMREYINTPISTLQQALWEFRAIAHQMVNKPPIYRCAVLRNCSWCDFKKLCGQHLFGRSWEEMANWEFEKNEELENNEDSF